MDIDPKKYTLKQLIEFAQIDFYKKCLYGEQLRRFWNEKLIYPDVYNNELGLEYGYRGVRPHPLIHSLDLILGFIYYDKASKATGLEQEQLLLKSEQYGCFLAIISLNDKALKTLNSVSIIEAPGIIDRVMRRMQRCAYLYASSGYFELADSFKHIKHFWKKICNYDGVYGSSQLQLQSLLIAFTLQNTELNLMTNKFYSRISNDEILNFTKDRNELKKEFYRVINFIEQQANNIARQLIQVFNVQLPITILNNYLQNLGGIYPHF